MRRMYRKNLKTQLYIWGIILIALIITLVVLFTVYNNTLKEATERSLAQAESFINLIPTNDTKLNNNIEQASSDLGKGINEVINEVIPENIESETTVKETVETAITEQPVEEIEVEAEKKELVFVYPVEGEIARDFARETLIFSETLQEWTVHNGIDIKAERTTVVKAAEDGKVVAIKNDPRYGLTVIIEHIDGYKTIYSNLLTAEFVEEGEEILKGESIGTVGNSAPFEIADEAHLHFEMMLNNEYVDPKIYLQ